MKYFHQKKHVFVFMFVFAHLQFFMNNVFAFLADRITSVALNNFKNGCTVNNISIYLFTKYTEISWIEVIADIRVRIVRQILLWHTPARAPTHTVLFDNNESSHINNIYDTDNLIGLL